MKNKVFLLALAFSAVILASCGTVPLQRQQISQITKETALTDLDRILGKASVIAAYEFESNDKKYFAKHYSLQTGTRLETTVICTPTCIPVSIDVPVQTPYVVVHDVGLQKLHSWGTIEELSKSPDEAVSSIMPSLKKGLEQFRAANK